MRKNYIDAKDLMKITGVSKSKATNIIRELNEEMEKEGFIAIRGKLPIQLVREKFPYCDLSDEAIQELKEISI
ncbi:hypothetical protein [Staphylococcus carnosus]|uniref:hypothetical protein n=1 Tax=Staphylococcus carnosus TaxID=1281 RepID=UPI00081A59F0|nr:hypothetical protein [Staphylococcus carnosus]ANZ33906.1 hypothetical protein BEK99_08945 [Staphylococcus carnosus]UTB86087.1 hypothetical protein A2I66_10545 [Staphylococcus carnosus]